MISQAVVPLIFLLLLYAVKRYTACRQLVCTVKYVLPPLWLVLWVQRSLGCSGWPGFRTVFNDRFLFFPFRVRGISPGAQWPFYSKHADFAKAGWDVIALVRQKCTQTHK